ncbi:hypothetical protein B0H14DRAFT_549808 [Mycena olivaceomarginata]|nr:hypothetical protein B0H14DRAFT_549808 [Mycena olivaceomarginata]
MPIFFVPDDALEKYLAAVDAFAADADIPGAFVALGPHLQSQKSLDHLFPPPPQICPCTTSPGPPLALPKHLPPLEVPHGPTSVHRVIYLPKSSPLLFRQPREDLREETPLSPLQSPLSPLSYPELNEHENTCSVTGQCASASASASGAAQPVSEAVRAGERAAAGAGGTGAGPVHAPAAVGAGAAGAAGQLEQAQGRLEQAQVQAPLSL